MINFNLVVLQLKQALLNELPGERAHQILAPKNRLTNPIDYLQNNPNYKSACVMLLIYPVVNIPNLVFIERTNNGTHAGQIALPGGKKENDESYAEAAIRETYEEIGVSIDKSDILGQFSSIYIPPSNFLVHPFIAAIQNKPTFIIAPIEVKRIIEIPLFEFLKHDVIKEKVFTNSKSVPVNAPFYAINELEIWGATAMIISELTYVLKDILKSS